MTKVEVKVNKKNSLILILSVALVGFGVFATLNLNSKKLKQNSDYLSSLGEIINFNKNTRIITKSLVNSNNGNKYTYEMYLPKNWEIKETNNTTLIVNNGDYVLTIEDEYEGFNCEFDVSKKDENTSPYDLSLNLYKTFDTNWASFKLGFHQTNSEYLKATQFIFCQKYIYPEIKKEKWQGGSSIGLVTLTTPLKYDRVIIDSTQAIVSGIKLKEIDN